MGISLKAVLILAAVAAAGFIALMVLAMKNQTTSAIHEIELEIAALVLTTAVGFLYVGEQLKKG
jgi:hypothetical protein